MHWRWLCSKIEFFLFFLFWTPGCSRKGKIESTHPYFRLFERFLGIVLFFLNFGMVLETHMTCATESDFSEKIFLPQNWENGWKTRFIELLKSLVFNFNWTRSILKNYTLCFCTNPTYWKMFSVRLQNFLMNHISRTNQWNSLIFSVLRHIHIN